MIAPARAENRRQRRAQCQYHECAANSLGAQRRRGIGQRHMDRQKGSSAPTSRRPAAACSASAVFLDQPPCDLFRRAASAFWVHARLLRSARRCGPASPAWSSAAISPETGASKAGRAAVAVFPDRAVHGFQRRFASRRNAPAAFCQPFAPGRVRPAPPRRSPGRRPSPSVHRIVRQRHRCTIGQRIADRACIGGSEHRDRRDPRCRSG